MKSTEATVTLGCLIQKPGGWGGGGGVRKSLKLLMSGEVLLNEGVGKHRYFHET